MTFHYEAHDKLGQIVKGTVEADSEEDAAHIIREKRGHYAREISQEPVKGKYEYPAVGTIAPKPEAAKEQEEPEEKATTTPEENDPFYKIREEAFASLEKSLENCRCGGKCSQKRSREDVLRGGLEGVSEVLRLMHTWLKVYNAAVEHDTDLPPGTPRLGGRTWSIFEAHLDELARDLIGEAMRRAASS